MFTFVDLFAGIGGFRRAFEAVGGKCVFTSEIDEYALRTYKANYNTKHVIARDITQVRFEFMPDFDVLCAGFPCQPFSIAGVSKRNSLNRPVGLADTVQGTLFFYVASAINHKMPKAVLLENVKNFTRIQNGEALNVMLNLLKQLGYSASYTVLDSSCFVPQKRERLFIVALRDGQEFVWPDLPKEKHTLSEILEPPLDVPDTYTLSDKLWTYLQGYAAKHKAKGNGFGCTVNGPDDVARTLSARYYKDGSEILVAQDGKNPRRLTPRECARLMGYPDSFRIPVSDTRAYKQFGNSVVVPLVEWIARAMLPYIVEDEARR